MTEKLPPLLESAPQETEATIPQKPALKERIINALGHPKAPYVAGAILLAIAGTVALYANGFTPKRLLGSPAIVTFDPVRFMNAQRAAASIMAVNPNADLALSMTQVAKQAEIVIRQEAHGAVILVKQAVVAQEDIPDITEAVLQRFGLPTNVPTVTTDIRMDNLEDIAPTDSAFSQGKLREDYRLELEAKRARLVEKQNKESNQTNAIP